MTANSNAAHTPLPWGISYGFNLGLMGAPATYIAGPKPEHIGIKLATPWMEGAWDNDPEADANVAFIVRACNAHYELIDALRAVRQWFMGYAANFGTDVAEEIALIDAALASADTRPEGGDSTKIEAPFMSGAVPKADAQPQVPSP